MSEDLEQLGRVARALAPLTDAELEAFLAPWTAGSARRGEVLTPAGGTERYLYFITKGVQRVVQRAEDGREATLVFTYPPSFGGVLDSFLLQQPAAYGYEALGRSAFLRISYGDLQKLMTAHPAVHAMITRGLSGVINGLLQRLAELQTATAEEKFRNLLRRSPHILQLVPHKYLATYIGIDPTNFSKFINRVAL